MPRTRLSHPPVLAGDPELGLGEAVQQCLSCPVVAVAKTSAKTSHEATRQRGVVLIHRDLSVWRSYTVAQSKIDTWELAGIQLRKAGQTPHLLRSMVAARNQVLDDVLADFVTHYESLHEYVPKANPLSVGLGWLWWHEQVAAGVDAPTAWTMLALRLPADKLQHFRFTPETHTLSCVDGRTTVFGD